MHNHLVVYALSAQCLCLYKKSTDSCLMCSFSTGSIDTATTVRRGRSLMNFNISNCVTVIGNVTHLQLVRRVKTPSIERNFLFVGE